MYYVLLLCREDIPVTLLYSIKSTLDSSFLIQVFKLKISIPTELIEFFFQGKLQIGPGMALGFFFVFRFKPKDYYRLFARGVNWHIVDKYLLFNVNRLLLVEQGEKVLNPLKLVSSIIKSHFLIYLIKQFYVSIQLYSIHT